MTIDFEAGYFQPRRGVINSTGIMSSLRDLKYGRAMCLQSLHPFGIFRIQLIFCIAIEFIHRSSQAIGHKFQRGVGGAV